MDRFSSAVPFINHKGSSIFGIVKQKCISGIYIVLPACVFVRERNPLIDGSRHSRCECGRFVFSNNDFWYRTQRVDSDFRDRQTNRFLSPRVPIKTFYDSSLSGTPFFSNFVQHVQWKVRHSYCLSRFFCRPKGVSPRQDGRCILFLLAMNFPYRNCPNTRASHDSCRYRHLTRR